MEKTEREKVTRVSSLTEGTWSNWYTALVPSAPNNSGRYESRGEDDDGYIYSEIRERFHGPQYDDGIYELSVSRKVNEQESERFVVYIGAAHRDGPGSLSQRIMEYCNHGSHKAYLINKALRLGYTLYVRVKNIPGSKEHVYECEDRYLAKYDYAWNKRKNGRIRKSVPPR